MVGPPFSIRNRHHMSKIKFVMPVIFVQDMARSREFYQKLFNLEIEHDFGANISFKNGFSLWEKGSAMSIIHGVQNKEHSSTDQDSMPGLRPSPLPYKELELYFETEDMDTVSHELATQKLDLIHDLKEEPWGQRTIRFYDPDGFIVEVAETMDAVILRLAAQGMSVADVAARTQHPVQYVEMTIARGK